MFTGIVETTATVRERADNRLRVSRPDFFTDIKEGASIAVAGVCLTVADMDADSMAFDVVAETWNKTALDTLEVGDAVNVERALSASGRFEGHIVQGHIEGTAEVTALPTEQNDWRLSVRLPADLLPLVVAKGSITIDGVSLTVASLMGDDCIVALIPHTLEHTTLGALQVGDKVNIETDILGRYVQALLSSHT